MKCKCNTCKTAKWISFAEWQNKRWLNGNWANQTKMPRISGHRRKVYEWTVEDLRELVGYKTL